jgi:hypothetical protein
MPEIVRLDLVAYCQDSQKGPFPTGTGAFNHAIPQRAICSEFPTPPDPLISGRFHQNLDGIVLATF